METAADDDHAEGLVDKLKGGDYKDMVKTAQSAHDAQQAAQQLCLDAAGGVSKASPYTAFAGMGQQQAPVEDELDVELRRAREARRAQLRAEQTWKQQGHGTLRELRDETEFVEIIGPHERGIMLLDDGRDPAGEDVKRALDRLAKSHMEAQFCSLPADRAHFLTRMVELESLPAIFVLQQGQVTRHLPPRRLFEFASASSPLFKGHLETLLHKVGALLNAEGSDSEGEGSEDEKPKRGLGTWRRM